MCQDDDENQKEPEPFSLPQGFTFGKAGEILTTRLRSMAFKAMLRQVSELDRTPGVKFKTLPDVVGMTWLCFPSKTSMQRMINALQVA